ncbi:unnamed protein product [Didymodactylos carnosus]|uniref:Uncharacterized protein n=1 Tax=Didymodactylos carnosus TaxID=1234261 RepID=A0A815RQ82_9BILA|nr:unnamed protein product [Didymodactylos carnosus]CAF1595389.1 unnamed protein product [Didymodactylos carnosus]CAF4344865.1 unnamed protein product [Didymodactylos carnosus]CAF4401347.1 unnamed protein product [Didymodactylos carnosus]
MSSTLQCSMIDCDSISNLYFHKFDRCGHCNKDYCNECFDVHLDTIWTQIDQCHKIEKHVFKLYESKQLVQNKSQPMEIVETNAFQRYYAKYADRKNNKKLTTASLMAKLAGKFVCYSRPVINDYEKTQKWHDHRQQDYMMFRTLLEKELCAPLLWIEHVNRLLDGNLNELKECVHYFDEEEKNIK